MLPEQLIYKILDVMKVGLTYIDENEKVVYLNNEAIELLKIGQLDIIGNSLLNCHPEHTRRTVMEKIEQLRESPREEWHRTIEHDGRFLENYYSSVFIDQQYRGIVIATKDVTERETLDRALHKSFDEMSVLFEAAQLVNSSLNIKQVLDNIVCLAQKVVGFDAGGILLFDRDSKEIVHDATYNYAPGEVAALKQCRPFGELLETMEKDYIVQPVENHFTCSLLSKIEMAVPMEVNNEIYGIWFVENHRDEHFSSDRKKMLATLANLTSSAIKNAWLYERTRFDAINDQLTGLFNRQYFERVFGMEKEKSRLLQSPLGLIMVDLNRLKYINDNFGHEMGDFIIREAAMLLKKSVRKGELIFRFGGDEMVILLPGSDARETLKVAKRIRTNMEEWNRVNTDRQMFLHLSIGWSTARDAHTLQKLLSSADENMYRDKAEYYKAQGLVRESTGPR